VAGGGNTRRGTLGTFAQLEVRGTGTHVVRMVLAGKSCSDGGKTLRCVYEELRPDSMLDWTGRQSFCGPQACGWMHPIDLLAAPRSVPALEEPSAAVGILSTFPRLLAHMAASKAPARMNSLASAGSCRLECDPHRGPANGMGKNAEGTSGI
jgi:hypothetical protein